MGHLRLGWTNIFDIWARVNGNHVAMLDAEVMANDTVDASTTIVELFIGKNDEDCILPLLSTNKDGIAAEKLKAVHCGF